MDLQLADKTALVMASSKGIGRGVALGLARERCRVIVTSSNLENARRAAQEIGQETGAKVSAYTLDVFSPADVDKALDQITAEQGPVDILVTNGPGPPVRDAAALERGELEKALQASLFSVARACTRLMPSMIERRFGRIINLTSTTGKEPDEGMVLSNVCRAAVLAHAKTLSREVAKHGITVNSILTGSVMSERAVNLLTREAKDAGISYEEMLRQAEKSIPVGYISTPAQFAATVVFLASPLAGYVNGVSLAIDGGTMRGL